MEAKSIDCQKKSIFLVSVLPASKIEASDSQACEAFIAAIIWVKISTSAPSCVMVPANSTRAPPSSDSRRRNCGTNLEYEALGPAASARGERFGTQQRFGKNRHRSGLRHCGVGAAPRSIARVAARDGSLRIASRARASASASLKESPTSNMRTIVTAPSDREDYVRLMKYDEHRLGKSSKL